MGRTAIVPAERKIRVVPIASGTPVVAPTEEELTQGYVGNLADLTAQGFSFNPSTGDLSFTPLSSQEGNTVSFYYYLVDSTTTGIAPHYYDSTRYARVDIKVKAPVPPVSEDIEIRIPISTATGSGSTSENALPALDEGLTYVIQRRLTGLENRGFLVRSGTDTTARSALEISHDGNLYYRQVKFNNTYRPHSATYEYVVRNEAGQESTPSKITVWVYQSTVSSQRNGRSFTVNFLSNMATTTNVTVKNSSVEPSSCAALPSNGSRSFSRSNLFNCVYTYELQQSPAVSGFDPGPFMYEVEVTP